MPNYERLADAIKKAEGDKYPYGILTHYKYTSYRQACINTCKHAWKDYSNMTARTQWRGCNSEIQYLEFLSKRYCPIGAKNDPKGLNKNWLKNVEYYYNKGEIK